jgi:adenylate kinase family enzyme
MSLLSAPVFAISGSPRVGKTSLGEEVSRKLGFSFTSFGDYVRSIAKASSSGAASYRRALQDLGQRLVEDDPRGFCGAVLARCRGDISEPLVIDGLRHLRLEPVLRELLPTRDMRLIYVESRPSTRLLRWDGHASEEEVALVDAHPVERDLALLRNQSDLIIDTTEGFEPALALLLKWITDAYPSLSRRNPVGVATGSKS